MGEIAALLTAMTWAAASLLFVRLSGRGASANGLNLFKCVAGFGLFGATGLVVEGALWPSVMTGTDALWLLASAVLGIAVADSAYFEALSRLGARRGVLAVALGPPTTALMAVPLLGEPLTTSMWVGMAFTLGGITLVLRDRTMVPGRTADAPIDGIGVALALLYVVTQAFANVAIKRVGIGASALSICTARLGMGAVALLAFLVVTGKLRASVAPLRRREVVVPATLATIVGTYVGVWLSMLALRHTAAGVATTLGATTPLYVMLYGRAALEEPVSMHALTGALLAVVGVAVLMLT